MMTPERAKQAGLKIQALTASKVGEHLKIAPLPANNQTPTTPNSSPASLRKLMGSANHKAEKSAPNNGQVALSSAESAAGKMVAA